MNEMQAIAKMKRVCREVANEAARQGVPESIILGEAKWCDGTGNRYSVRLRAMAIGLPSYCLEFPSGDKLWLEEDGIAELARFFGRLEKHAAATDTN